MNALELSSLSFLHKRSFCPTIVPSPERDHAKTRRHFLAEHALIVCSSNASHRRCTVMTLSVKEPKEAEPKQAGNLKNAAVKTPKKSLRIAKSRKPEIDAHSGWIKMMLDIKEMGSPVQVFRIYKKAGKLSKETMVGTLMRFKKMKEWEFITETLEWLRKQNWWTFGELDYNLLIVAYAKLGEPEKVERAMQSMKKAGFAANVASYTSLIEAYGRRGLLSKAEGIFKKMLKEGPSPTALTYQTIIGAFIKGERYEDAERIFNTMSEEAGENFKPDQKLFNLMIHSYGKSGKPEEAAKLSRKMKALDVPLSNVTFNTLMACQSSVKDTENVFRQMQRAQLEPDAFSYAARISAFSKARRAEEAYYFFKTMIASGIRPNRTVYNALLDAFAKSKMVKEAESIFQEMKHDRCSPDLHSYTTLMNVYVNVSNMEKAQRVFERMKIAGIVPNIVSYSTLLKGYADKGDLEGMVKKYEEMLNEGIKPNQTVFTIMIQAFGRQESLDKAISWFKEMITAGLTPDERARSTLVTLSRAEGRKQEVLDLLESLA